MACNTCLRASLVMLLLAVVAWEQLVAGSKIAYKKPLHGKLSYVKEQRFRQRTTSSPATSSTVPAPVEFIINSTPRSTSTESMLKLQTEAETQTEAEPESSGSGYLSSSTPSSNTELEPELEAGGSSTPASLDNTLPLPPTAGDQLNQPVPCTCGVFLSSQMQNGLPEMPLIHNEMDRMYPCNAIGRKQCQTKCLEAIVQHLPNSANIVCATLGHDCHKERAYLFIKNCHNQWVNTNLQAGREYCCKAGLPYRCPLLG
ncbi:follicle cell protein 3C-1 [Drosophila virilis]|uniref:Follicle cell protein 3C-1 n=1 Tax=Drosophila virilis TaxID=7244 RepID=B4MCT4_DROVI|nr:follicle cell protein 3C-1 [Drosophila virilis]EDW58006.2 uncharacterized protein Dvir_GJ15268 [Drosophila virilis]